MAPPIPSHMKRFTANVAKPTARYRPGKAVQESSDEAEGESEEEQEQQPPKPRPSSQVTPVRRPQHPVRRREEEEEDEDEEGFVTEDEGEEGIISKPARSSARTQTQSNTAQLDSRGRARAESEEDKEEEDEEDSAEDESDDESDGEESSSVDESTQRKFLRPTFVKKSDRIDTASTHETHTACLSTTPAPEISSSTTTRAASERRLEQATLLIKDTIEKDTLARLAGKKNWDDDDELSPEALIDDTDNLDPEAEYSAWRLREFHRLKRDREQLIAREKELEETERRRNLSQAERDAEDREFLDNQRAEKEGRGQAAVLARYHHKGAFFMDDEASQKMAQRDLMGARFADDVADKSTLPEYMRVRDMTKLGKKGRTRYRDLKGEDTGHFGHEVKRWRGSGYEQSRNRDKDLRNVDERFLPDTYGNGRADAGGSGSKNGSGANNIEIGVRRSKTALHRDRDRSRSRSRNASSSPPNSNRHDYRSTTENDFERKQTRPRRRSRSRSRSRSHSYSPQPRSTNKRRTPSPSTPLDRDRDKRRRINT